jgi:hypothetical protein
MAKFDNNPNTQYHKFDNSKSNTTKFMLSKEDMNNAMSSALSIWDIQGLTEKEYYEKHPITPAHIILKMSKEDWEESLKPKTNGPNLEPIIEEETTDLVVNSDINIISDIVESLDLGVQKVINKIETKLKKTTKQKSLKW